MSTARSVMAATILVTGAASFVMTGTTPAHAEEFGSYGLDFTAGMGAYPRSLPMYEARVGAALPENTTLPIECFTVGETITNVYNYSSDVWLRSVEGQFFPEAWVNTNSEGAPAGMPDCATLEADTIDTSPAEWTPTCDPDSEYIAGEISLSNTGDDRFTISFAPTDKGRFGYRDGYGWDATVDMWHDIQGCVPGLYDSLADSIFQQLECHQMGGEYTKPVIGGYMTGDTYDLESWHPALRDPNVVNYALTKCGNGLLFPGMNIFAGI